MSATILHEPIPIFDGPALSKQGFEAGQERTRAALARQVDLHPRRARAAQVADTVIRPRNRKPEDTAEGCRARADADRAEAAELGSDRMRFRLERSADAWNTRADLLQRLQRSDARDNSQ